ncbi:MAG: magnesium transporter [Actinobacteria bacterium]|nr:magnesium transporter [Actinomycetota bacterium]
MRYLSTMLDKRIYRSDGTGLGRLEDVMVTGATKFPFIEGIIVKAPITEKRRRYYVSWNKVSIGEDGKWTAVDFSSDPIPEGNHFLLCRDLLDKQIVDLDGYKIVRVTDVRLARAGSMLRVVGVDIGVLAILRRLGLGWLADRMRGRLRGELWDKTVSWNLMAPVEQMPYDLKLIVPYKEYLKAHPSDIADIVEQLDETQRVKMFALIDDPKAASVLVNVIPGKLEEVADSIDNDRLSDLLEIMPPDEAADILGSFPRKKAELLLSLMEIDEASVVSELLGYDPDTAGGRMTTEYVSVSRQMTPETVMEKLRREHSEAETIYYLYVVDSENHLSGVVSLRDLLRAASEEKIGNIMSRDIIASDVMDSQEDVAEKLVKYNLLALPIVDNDHVMKGIVTYDDAMDVMMEEASEDLSRISGVPFEDEGTPVQGILDRRRWYWTFLTFMGGLAGMVLFGIFRPVFAAALVLVYFIPLAMRATNNVSVWSLASAVYGLTTETAFEINWKEIFQREYGYMIAVSSFTALVTFLVGRVWTQNLLQAFAAAAGIFMAVLLAGTLGIVIPVLLFQLSYGKIKSQGSLIKTAMMVVSISSYLLIGWAILRYWG